MPQPGNVAIGPVAQMLSGNRLPAIRPLARGINTKQQGPEQRWRGVVGSMFLYTAARWGVSNWYLEVTGRDISGAGLARLWDVTSSSVVTGSTVTDSGVDAAGVERNRSGAFTLTDGHEYRVEFGVQDGGAYGVIGAKLIGI